MRELSLHILDIVQNSIAAEAEMIQLTIEEDYQKNKLMIKIEDDGKGMTKEQQQQVVDPFVTSRTTRKVGLGLPLFKAAAQRCDGEFELESSPGEGTVVTACFKHDHIDRAPLGNIVGTITTLVRSNPELELKYTHRVGEEEFVFDTREIKVELEGVKINQPKILTWIKDYLKTNLAQLRR
jgi:signal transduction histidine kinase